MRRPDCAFFRGARLFGGHHCFSHKSDDCRKAVSMRVSALKLVLLKTAMSSPYLCDDYLTAPHFPPRGPLEPWCASVSDHLQEAIRDRRAHIDEIADGFEQAAEIALLLGRLGEAKKLRLAAIAYFMGEVDAGSGTFAAMPALWMLLGLARIERALGRYDEALFVFERIAALGSGESLDEGPLVLTTAQIDEMQSSFPESAARLRFVAIAEALETLVRAGRYDSAITAARARRTDDPPWLGAFRCETIATALGRLGLVRETIVYLASVIAQRPEYPRLAFEQKRAEALASDGRFEEAAARLAFIAETLEQQWTTTPATLSDVALAARTSLLASILGRHAESARLAARAREFARELGDVPLEAELALRIMESDAPSDVRADAADALTHILLATGYAITLPRGGVRPFEAAMPPANEPRAPTYPSLRDRLYAIAA
jgi:tetratricopeptide (TPR) repeat protein